MNVLDRARDRVWRVGRAASDLRPIEATALRIPRDRQPPPPSAFRRWGDRSFLVPPARVAGADRIEVGDEVLILEDAGLQVGDGARLVIGDRTRLAPGAEVLCSVSVTIGRAVSSSDYVAIVDSWGPDGARGTGAPIVVEDGAYLGWGSIVGPGVRIGAGAFVGEGAVVLDDVAAGTVVYGNPARVVAGYGARS